MNPLFKEAAANVTAAKLDFGKYFVSMGLSHVELAELEAHVFVVVLVADIEVTESSLGWGEVWR